MAHFLMLPTLNPYNRLTDDEPPSKRIKREDQNQPSQPNHDHLFDTPAVYADDLAISRPGELCNRSSNFLWNENLSDLPSDCVSILEIPVSSDDVNPEQVFCYGTVSVTGSHGVPQANCDVRID